jgi:hypothetical protein
MINELVDRLSKGEHEVTIGHENESNEDIKKRIENGFIHVKFVNTKGGTELGINLDLEKTKLDEFDSAIKSGVFHIEGTTNLNYVQTRCIVDINLSSRNGKGRLEVLD